MEGCALDRSFRQRLQLGRVSPQVAVAEGYVRRRSRRKLANAFFPDGSYRADLGRLRRPTQPVGSCYRMSQRYRANAYVPAPQKRQTGFKAARAQNPYHFTKGTTAARS